MERVLNLVLCLLAVASCNVLQAQSGTTGANPRSTTTNFTDGPAMPVAMHLAPNVGGEDAKAYPLRMPYRPKKPVARMSNF
jgi:hypothetical protein